MRVQDLVDDFHNRVNRLTSFMQREFSGLTPADRVKFFLAIFCTVTSVWIGFEYATYVRILGWQIWTWLGCVLVTVTLLYRHKGKPSRAELLILLALVAVSLALRLPALGSIPGLFHVDEVGVSRFARDDLLYDPKLVVSPFVTGPSSQPALYHYIILFTMKVFGFNIAGARVSSAIAGALGVAAVYLMIKQLSNRQIALYSAIVMAGYHFSIHFSRLALNNIWDTLWVPLIIYGFVKGWDEDWIGGAVIAGAALGLSQYFYHGSKLVVFLLLFLLVTHWKTGGTLSRKIWFLSTIALVTICIAGPMIMFQFASPEIFYARLRDDWGWSAQAVNATLKHVDYWQYFWYQFLHALGTYTIYPDPSGFYRPGIPLVIGLSAILFMAGIVIAFVRKDLLPVVWIGLTSLFGGFMLSVPHSSPHYVVAIPAICWLIGLGINWIKESGYGKASFLLLSAIVIIDLYFYFLVFSYAMPGDFNIPFPPMK